MTSDAIGANRSTLALGVTVVLWASAFVGIRDAGESFDPGELTLGRLVLGALALTVVLRPWRASRPARRPLLLIVFAGVFWFGGYNLALNAGEQYVDAGTAALLVNIGGILVAVLAGLWLGEGFPRALFIGIAIAFLGVLLIAVGSGGLSGDNGWLGVGLCALAAFSYAVGTVAQKPALAVVDPALSVWISCWVGALVCLPWMPSLIDQFQQASTRDQWWLIYLAIFPTAIGFSTWFYALKHLTAGQTASTAYLIPAVAIGFSWLLLNEVPTALALVGGVVCLAGVAVTRRRPRTVSPTAR